MICEFSFQNTLHTDLLRIIYLLSTVTTHHHSWFYIIITSFLKNHTIPSDIHTWNASPKYNEFIKHITNDSTSFYHIKMRKTITHTIRKAFGRGNTHESQSHMTILIRNNVPTTSQSHLDIMTHIQYNKLNNIYNPFDIVEFVSYNVIQAFLTYHESISHSDTISDPISEPDTESDTESETDIESDCDTDSDDAIIVSPKYYPNPKNVVISSNGSIIDAAHGLMKLSSPPPLSLRSNITKIPQSVVDIIQKYANHNTYQLPNDVPILKLYKYTIHHKMHINISHYKRALFYMATNFIHLIDNGLTVMTFPLCQFSGILHKLALYHDAFIIATHCTKDKSYCSSHLHRQISLYYQHGLGGAPISLHKTIEHYYPALAFNANTTNNNPIKNTSTSEFKNMLIKYKNEYGNTHPIINRITKDNNLWILNTH